MDTNNIDFFEFNNLIFSSIREISHKIDLLLQDTANEAGITTLQLKMLITLYANDKPISIGQLGKSIGVTGGNISNICKKLEKEGFVNRSRSEIDERVVNVELTDKGRETANMASKYFDQIRQDIPDEEGVKINLKKIIDELERLTDLLDGYISRSGANV